MTSNTILYLKRGKLWQIHANTILKHANIFASPAEEKLQFCHQFHKLQGKVYDDFF